MVDGETKVQEVPAAGEVMVLVISPATILELVTVCVDPAK
jgi:hypothetical protein